jgi:hypothetical protein
MSWHSTSRYLRNTLEKNILKELDDLGFDWNPNKSTWDSWYKEFEGFVIKYKTTLVPPIIELKKLSMWVQHQRAFFKKGNLSAEKIAQLNKLGFLWDVEMERWDENYKELKKYYEEHGNSDYPVNTKLGIWVSTQRYSYKKGKLSDEKINSLNRIGFKWKLISYDKKQKTWDERYEELRSYFIEHSDLNIPYSDNRYKSLTKWVERQRYSRKSGTLSDGRVEALNLLGFKWSVL